MNRAARGANAPHSSGLVCITLKLIQDKATPHFIRLLEEWFRNKNYHGCSFGEAATEFRDPKHAVHKMASEHKQQILVYFRELAAAAAGAKDPELLAKQMDLLVESALPMTPPKAGGRGVGLIPASYIHQICTISEAGTVAA